MVNNMDITCENCGTTLSVRTSAELRYITREPAPGKGAEYLIVEGGLRGDVLVHSCVIGVRITSNR